MRRVLIAAGILVIALVVILSLRGPSRPEPQYNGVPLSTLVLQGFRDKTVEDEVIESRLSSLDTNALPFLIDWIRFEPPAWRGRLAHFVLKTSRRHGGGSSLAKRIISTRRFDLAIGSLRAFHALGTNAAPAIPTLAAMMNDRSSPDAAFNALQALGYIGTNSLPPLLEAARDPQHLFLWEVTNIINDLLGVPETSATSGISNAATNAVPELLTNTPAK
jgi:hypothetical protein